MTPKETGMTRREFLAQAAATSVAASMMGTENAGLCATFDERVGCGVQATRGSRDVPQDFPP